MFAAKNIEGGGGKLKKKNHKIFKNNYKFIVKLFFVIFCRWLLVVVTVCGFIISKIHIYNDIVLKFRGVIIKKCDVFLL